jgi:hypothetical protein
LPKIARKELIKDNLEVDASVVQNLLMFGTELEIP